jgi:hypothetical protein
VGLISRTWTSPPRLGARFSSTCKRPGCCHTDLLFATHDSGTAFSAISAGISDDFVTQVKALKKPGTSAVFVVEAEGDMEVILHAIRGLGGTVLKTNVDVERARLNQSALAASPSGLGA